MTDLIFASNHYSWHLLLDVAGLLGLLIDVEGRMELSFLWALKEPSFRLRLTSSKSLIFVSWPQWFRACAAAKRALLLSFSASGYIWTRESQPRLRRLCKDQVAISGSTPLQQEISRRNSAEIRRSGRFRLSRLMLIVSLVPSISYHVCIFIKYRVFMKNSFFYNSLQPLPRLHRCKRPSKLNAMRVPYWLVIFCITNSSRAGEGEVANFREYLMNTL